MTRDLSDHDLRQLDRFLDDAMPAAEQSGFRHRLENEPGLRAGLQQRRLEKALMNAQQPETQPHRRQRERHRVAHQEKQHQAREHERRHEFQGNHSRGLW